MKTFSEVQFALCCLADELKDTGLPDRIKRVAWASTLMELGWSCDQYSQALLESLSLESELIE